MKYFSKNRICDLFTSVGTILNETICSKVTKSNMPVCMKANIVLSAVELSQIPIIRLLPEKNHIKTDAITIIVQEDNLTGKVNTETKIAMIDNISKVIFLR